MMFNFMRVIRTIRVHSGFKSSKPLFQYVDSLSAFHQNIQRHFHSHLISYFLLKLNLVFVSLSIWEEYIEKEKNSLERKIIKQR